VKRARIGSPRLQSEVAKLVDELVSGYKSMASKGVTLVARLGEDVPKEVIMDPLRVKQILSNGLTNALKHTKTGSVVLQVLVLRPLCWQTCRA
jgi:signal transduction histidine kinase